MTIHPSLMAQSDRERQTGACEGQLGQICAPQALVSASTHSVAAEKLTGWAL